MKTLKRKERWSWLGTILFTFVSILYLAPIVIVLFNSFKKKVYISKYPFQFPSEKSFTGFRSEERRVGKEC